LADGETWYDTFRSGILNPEIFSATSYISAEIFILNSAYSVDNSTGLYVLAKRQRPTTVSRLCHQPTTISHQPFNDCLSYAARVLIASSYPSVA
jgi:hypothetical protein